MLVKHVFPSCLAGLTEGSVAEQSMGQATKADKVAESDLKELGLIK